MAKAASDLSDRQLRFVAEYAVDGNGTQAAIRAGLRVVERGDPIADSYVYGLLGHDGSLFYVGKGRRNRWLNHFARGDKHNPAKGLFARSVAAPSCVVFAEGVAEARALAVERALIGALRDRLTNVSGGAKGLGGFSERERSRQHARAMLACASPLEVWRTRAPRTPEQEQFYARLLEEMRLVARDGWQNAPIVLTPGA